MNTPASSMNKPTQMTIKAEDVSLEDHQYLMTLVEGMKARKAAAAPGDRANPISISSDSDEELLARQQQQQQLHYLSPLLQHGLYTPQQFPLQASPSLTQKKKMMMETPEPGSQGTPTPGYYYAPPSEPEIKKTKAASPWPPTGPSTTSYKRKHLQATVENASNSDSKSEPDSDDEPLRAKRTRRLETPGSARRQSPKDGASDSVPAMPEAAMMPSPAPSAPLNCALPAATKKASPSPPPGHGVPATDKSHSPTTRKIPRCRGSMTFQQARQQNGGNYIFQWPAAGGGARSGSSSGNDKSEHFILVCDSRKCPASKRGYFWRHPFMPRKGCGVPADSHFQGHLSKAEMMAKYGWNVVDAGEHLDEIQEHNAMLAKKTAPIIKGTKRQAHD